MQTPKTSTKSSSGSEGVRRISPRSVSSDTTVPRSSARAVRQLKTSGLEPSSSAIRAPKITSPRIISSRATLPELQKKRVGRVAELESQVTQLEEALRTVKDQLIVSESWKKQAKLDAEESRKELLDMSLKLEESRKLLAQSSLDEHDPKAVGLADSAALAAAFVEIDQLKDKLDTITESEATQTKQSESAYVEIHILKENMAKTLLLMEDMKSQLEDCKISESQAQALASETLLQLETAKKTMESFKLTSGEYNAILLELDQSRARIRSLEGIIKKMKTKDQEKQSSRTLDITAELKRSKADIQELKANLMDKETELQCILEENEDLKVKLADLMLGEQENDLENDSKQDFNRLKSQLTNLETELREKLDENEKLKLEIMDTKGLTSLEKELRKKLDENEKLKLESKNINSVIEVSKQDFNSLKLKLQNLEMELREKSDDNEKLKLEIKKMKSNNEVAEVTEQLEAVKMTNYETEEELKRLKVQMGQWRKAAEVATAMLCDENSDNNGRMLMERSCSMGHYNISSPCSLEIDDDDDDEDEEEEDDEFSKRKNGNMLKRIGVLWKKPRNK
ncbi:interactor of constitutive active ROPs 3-like [Cynara cardunculus var. scolymus]|uniref:interactor of constitutive active ROPs 3-like n=1 Tax=Cynara cardunculus var. scolymus TaxID=59895 RepID=UPI000D625533|nr:interactor of constitutive active ROPs 3-like [Cynara cardunculus var. scolymus]